MPLRPGNQPCQRKTTGPVATIQKHKISKFRKIPNMLDWEGKYTLRTSDHHHPFSHKNDKERLPSWPCQEGIRSSTSHTKWLSTTFYLVPAGGKRKVVVKSLQNPHTDLPENLVFQKAWPIHWKRQASQSGSAAQAQSSYEGEGGRPEPNLSHHHPKQNPVQQQK